MPKANKTASKKSASNKSESPQKSKSQALKALIQQLRLQFLHFQQQHRNQNYPIVIILEGLVDEKIAELGNKLYEWLDGRFVERQIYGRHESSDKAGPYPNRYRDWLGLPKYGQMGIYFGSWYTPVVQAHLDGDLNNEEFHDKLAEIKKFEALLLADNAQIVKFWLKCPKQTMKQQQDWMQLNDAGWLLQQQAEQVDTIYKTLKKKTDHRDSKWQSLHVEGQDFTIEAGQKLWQLLNKRSASSVKKLARRRGKSSVLQKLNLDASLSKSDYKSELVFWQSQLRRLTAECERRGIAVVFAFEGADAAGKGGAIRRLMTGMDARQFRVYPISAPSQEERQFHYLHRFWRRLPKQGKIAIFDRTWYGRVLVERVEGFASEAEWQRAFAEINDFESQLTESRYVLLKFWLQIDEAEQLKRFTARQNDPTKLHKITEEDWRNRDKWPAYQQALVEMLARTNSKQAPWHLVAANCKRHARIQVLKTSCKTLQKRLFQR